MTDSSTGPGAGSSTSNASSQPAGFLASSSRTWRPSRSTWVYRPATEVTDRIFCRAAAGGTPNTSATASAITALDRLARPGRASDSSVTCPAESMTEGPSSTQRAAGRLNSHSPHRQPRSSRRRCDPQRGQHQESSCQRWPAATQVTWWAPLAAQAISGSSALATTRQSGAASNASRQRRATSQISAARSIWSRLRLSSVTTRALVARRTAGTYFSSVSRTAYGASGAWPSAAASPASMLAPNALEATSWPIALSAAVIRRVVVVLPFVPVTRTISRSAASSASRPGLHAQADDPADHGPVAPAREA